MRNFKKVFPRICAVLAFVIIFESAVRFAYEDWDTLTTVSRTERRELTGTLDTLFCGTSVVYRAVNPVTYDEKMGTSSYNTATASQPVKGTYYLIQEAVEQNPIKEIYLGITIPTLKAERLDIRYVSAFENMLTWKWKLRYLMSLKSEPILTTALFYSTRVEHYYQPRLVLENVKSKLTNKKARTYGQRGFRASNKVYKGGGGSEKNSDGNYWDGTLGAEQIEPETLEYLKKIAEFCKEKDIKFTIFIAPWTQDYIDGAGDLDDMNRVCQELAEELDIDFYNFLLYKNRQEEFGNDKFKDTQHFNKKGGNTFTDLLAEVVASENPQEYFYDSMEEFAYAPGN
ncbi:hypothetical protein BRYFOR_07741 [Marvinbryantia formatexigens DSM 14469]|uniref:Uncharacterized protein n=1 Tax=Marvinbryantia formatexigens DSM 14469 TaxID=478749 RepID=C6LGI1_9FIRM|nr:hypothetical protein [Marvinbryantia formatexigens]EET60181.1 hypothetical protein BRYFOR_07741 [Marvinbryantia formatexigens DSM 14469]UWO24209.1 hypothetical protein NQ534_17555 [Marvinbryantia formatexigens DSM 14469]SDF59618.1 hypothetical protein SAMN05660368_01000 [Marvinbryantia formatexigens]